MTARLRGWRAALLARPWHVLLAALAVGLACGPRAPALLALAAALLAAATAPPWRLLAALVVLAGGAQFADARLAVLDRAPTSPRFGQTVDARATLLDTPRREARGGLRATVALGGDRVLLRWRGPRGALGAGEVVAVSGTLRAPGMHEAWLRPRHVHGVLEAASVRATGVRRSGVAGALDGVRRRALAALGRGLPPTEAGLLRGMVLGDDATLPPGARDELRRAGLGHLVAASGANIALLAILAMAAGAALGVGLRLRLCLVLALITLYVPLAGGGPSIRRAGIMGAAAIAATLASRPAARWHALLLAVAVTLALDPASAGDPGWQLSFAAVAAIAVLARPLRQALTGRGLPAALAEATALTVAATLGTAPVAAARFGTVSLASLPANVVVAPVVAPITWLGMVAALAAQAAPVLATPFTLAAAAPLGFVTGTAHVAAALPGASLRAPPLAVLAACALAAACALWPAVRRPAVAAVVAIAALAVGARVAAPRPDLAARAADVAFLDVGQGDATLLFDRGHAVLVDTGPPGGPVVRRLRALGVRRLDALLVTHAQADHDGAAPAVLSALRVDAVLDGRDGIGDRGGAALDRARAAGAAGGAPRAGVTIRAGGIVLRILSPGPGRTRAGDDPNRRAVVALARVRGLRVLLTADAESDVLAPLAPPRADVLKVSHHGSADPGLAALLREVAPRLAVVEVGAGNPYGHPAPSTLAALRSAGVPVLRTDRDGTVVVRAESGTLRVQRRS